MGHLYAVRHGETKWNVTSQHTSTTDLPLTEKGQEQARFIQKLLKGRSFSKIISSPMRRAKDTASLAGFTDPTLDKRLCEWDYGDYEGITTDEIREEIPDWNIFSHGAKNGESVDQVEQRAKQWIADINLDEGDILIFSHGHFLRVLASCWIGLGAKGGRSFRLSNASLSILSYERENRTIYLWNYSNSL